MQKFGFEWHIAYSKVVEKLRFTAFTPDFRGLPKKIWKIKERKPVSCEQSYSNECRVMSKYQFSTHMTKFVRLPPKMVKTKELFPPTAHNKLRLSAETAVPQTSSCPKTKLTGVQELWWALIKESGFVPCQHLYHYPHVNKKILRIIEEWMKCLHLKQSGQS